MLDNDRASTFAQTGSDEVLVGYVVVVVKRGSKDDGPIYRNPSLRKIVDEGSTTREMRTFNKPQAVLDFISTLGKDSKDVREVTRIFSINEHGVSCALEIVFDGRLKLKGVGYGAISEEEKIMFND